MGENILVCRDRGKENIVVYLGTWGNVYLVEYIGPGENIVVYLMTGENIVEYVGTGEAPRLDWRELCPRTGSHSYITSNIIQIMDLICKILGNKRSPRKMFSPEEPKKMFSLDGSYLEHQVQVLSPLSNNIAVSTKW